MAAARKSGSSAARMTAQSKVGRASSTISWSARAARTQGVTAWTSPTRLTLASTVLGHVEHPAQVLGGGDERAALLHRPGAELVVHPGDHGAPVRDRHVRAPLRGDVRRRPRLGAERV